MPKNNKTKPVKLGLDYILEPLENGKALEDLAEAAGFLGRLANKKAQLAHEVLLRVIRVKKLND